MDSTPRTPCITFADLRQIERAIPEGTPLSQLRVLQSRYRNSEDPVVAATPTTYRRVLLQRITHLLAETPAMDSNP
jgi:hypothetical protein